MTTYYTPSHWGKTLVDGIDVTSPTGIIDPAVGDGSLLVCCAERFSETCLFGIDVDPVAVAKSRAALPNAVISHANALELSSLARSAVWRRREEIDTVVINPPFAGGQKIYEVRTADETIVCSISAAHLLASIERYAPITLAAIMPCSFFHSDRDNRAVDAISQTYDMTRARDLHRAAFARGRASSEIVYLRRRDLVEISNATSCQRDVPERLDSSAIQVRLVRGAMPVHAAEGCRSTDGWPFLHTKGLIESGLQFRVSPMQRGTIGGFAVLLPRVGMPSRRHLRVREFSSPVQLSDCVLALCFLSMKHASTVCAALDRNFDTLLGCWAGTGAPYTTVMKIRELIHHLGFGCQLSSTWRVPARATANGHGWTVGGTGSVSAMKPPLAAVPSHQHLDASSVQVEPPQKKLRSPDQVS